MRAATRLLALSAALALAAQPAAAQLTGVVPSRGWVGVSVTIQTTQDGTGTRTTTTVTEVGEGSPADRAGIRPGDVLVSVNGRNLLPQDLQPGDTVRVLLDRDGQRRSVTLTAAPRPSGISYIPTLTVTFRADSMAERMYLAMDSVRARLAVTPHPRAGLVDVRDWVPFTTAADEAATGVWLPSEIRPPFGFYIFRGESHDSLTREMEQLNVDIRRLRSQQLARVRELERSGDPARRDRDDPELRRLQTVVLDLDRRANELRDAMERAAQRRPGETWVGPFSAGADRPETDRSDREARFRPLDVYLLGQNRAAGAEVVDLRPELAEYFHVEGGVLVVDVAEGTPAALAGIQPGDVLTRIGRLPMLSIQDLRKGLSLTGAEIPVTVVRKGRELQLLLVR